MKDSIKITKLYEQSL